MNKNRQGSTFAEALLVQTRAAQTGFDWPPQDSRLWDKLREEVGELQEAQHNPVEAEAELGDLLFMVANVARHLTLDPDQALQQAVQKFERRFAAVMQNAASFPPEPGPERLEAMERQWQAVKRAEAKR